MAMFREHVAVGAIVSMLVCVGVYFYALLTDPLLLAILFTITVIGSFLPDVDSDSGMPFYLVFGTATLLATGVVLLYTLSSRFAGEWETLIGIPAVAMLFFWFVVGGVIKKCTHHRGIFHSIPALVIAGVGTLLLARHYGLDDTIALILAGGMAAGYLCHLVLDEIHSSITIDGIPFNTKSSFGTALKLFSDSNRVNMATYLILAALVYTALDTRIAFAYYNDTHVIEVTDYEPPIPGAWGNPPAGSTGGAGGTFGSDPDEGEDEEATTIDDPAESTGGATSGGAGSGTTTIQQTGPGEDGSSSQEPESGDEVLDILFDDGALATGISAGSLFESILGGVWGEDAVFVWGGRVRESLRGKFDWQGMLADWRTGIASRDKKKTYGLAAASTAASDRNVDAILLSASAFEIHYRSRGYLFSIIPVTFPVKVGVIPAASSGRVTVRLPWYRFFVREFFKPATLATEIDAIIVAELKTAKGDEDATLRIFEVVTKFLRQKIGTVGDTVNIAQ